MTAQNSHGEPEITADLIAEAAAWLAVLHGPNRTAAAERGFSQWLKKSPAHARAFEDATTIWEEARSLPRPQLLRSSIRQQPVSQGHFLRTLGIAAVLALFAVGTMIYLQHKAGISTNIGEQRVLALEDGTRIILNTETRVVVSYDHAVRRVELKSGEAVFEVAKKPDWPFIVTTGNHQVEALGTSFAIRRDNQQLAVTLIEGKVAVSPATTGLLQRVTDSASQSGHLKHPDADTVMLVPGERVIFVDTQPARKDQPSLDSLLAWQRREVEFNDTALPDAVAEMNRYNRNPLRIDNVEAARIRVTGLFRAGDSLSFARAVAEAFHLTVAEQPDGIVLSDAPAEIHAAASIHP